MSISRRRLLVVGGVLLLVVAGAVTWIVASGEDEPDGRLAAAVAMAPADSARLGWTDWAGLRDKLDADLSAASPSSDVEQFLTDGFDADLTSTSALVASAPVLQEQYGGLGPATVDWELFSQSDQGAVVLIGLPDSYDIDRLEDTLRDIGYREPSSDDGVWIGGADLLAELGTVTQELAFLTIDHDRGIVAASDEAATLETWRDDDSDGPGSAISDVSDSVEGALSASIYSGDHACVALAMTQAADADRLRAQELIDQAGDINPLRAYAIATLKSGDVRVAMAFESEEQAEANADSRARLAAGPAPGQGGAFPDRFTLGPVTADGDVVTMDLDPLPGTYVMSDLATGPVLFATC